jgi:hypothetical protein
VYELNQSKQLASAQFYIDSVARETSIRIAMMGEDPREALAKAALHPADLNERDVVTLDAYYESIVLGWFNYLQFSQRAGIDVPWRENVAVSAQREFSSEPARRWLRAWFAGMDDAFDGTEIYEIVEKALQDDSGNAPPIPVRAAACERMTGDNSNRICVVLVHDRTGGCEAGRYSLART